MKTLLAIACMAAVLGEAAFLPAQVSTQATQSRGLFGPRNLGQPIAPRTGQFGGGIQTGTSGNFLYRGRADNAAMFVAPWRRPPNNVELDFYGNPLSPQAAMAPVATAPEVGAPASNLPQAPAAIDYGTPAAAGSEGENAAGSEVAPEGAAAAVTAPPRPPHFGVPKAAGAISVSPANRSATLSDRLTRIARSNGSLVSPRIDVYVAGGAAVLQGAVNSPHSRALLTHVVGLEPAVSQVDNRLVVADETLSGQARR